MATRASIHALVEELEDADLDAAQVALVEIKSFLVTDEDRQELLQRQTECDRGEVVDARDLLQTLMATPPE